MARLAGLELEHRWADWTRAPFTSDSRAARLRLPAALTGAGTRESPVTVGESRVSLGESRPSGRRSRATSNSEPRRPPTPKSRDRNAGARRPERATRGTERKTRRPGRRTRRARVVRRDRQSQSAPSPSTSECTGPRAQVVAFGWLSVVRRRPRTPGRPRRCGPGGEQVGADGVEQVVALEGEAVDEAQRRVRPVDLGHRDGAVEGHDRARGERQQLVVELQRSAASRSRPRVGASLWTALIAAWIWYGPGWLRAQARAARSPGPRRSAPRSQRPRSWSASSTRSPSGVGAGGPARLDRAASARAAP